MSFTYIDLFAGIGGFHSALGSFGGHCVWASEIDSDAARIYELNWGLRPAGDIVSFTDPAVSPEIPSHDMLTAGFPCQPFSKSGKQQGFRDTTRGTLFFNICQILEARRPPILFLENVRNLAGPRQKETWETIVRELRNLGYKVSGVPTVFSPHNLPAELGGAPQVRDRVFIFGIQVGQDRAWSDSDLGPVVLNQPVAGFDPHSWDINALLDPDSSIDSLDAYQLSESEHVWINAWDDFVRRIRKKSGGRRLPGFPLWADHFTARLPRGYQDLPEWKIDFLQKNKAFYLEFKSTIDSWFERWNDLSSFPASRRKLEWQAQDLASLWDCVLHLRPSGIRAKRPTYLPALVAITQTSIIGSRRRRITPNEAKRLQGLPEWFSFGDQRDPASYKQLGNGVSAGAAAYVLKEALLQNASDVTAVAPNVLDAFTATLTYDRLALLHKN